MFTRLESRIDPRRSSLKMLSSERTESVSDVVDLDFVEAKRMVEADSLDLFGG